MRFEKLNTLPIYDLLSEFNKLLDDKKIWWHQNNNDQICINTVPQHENDIHLGRGSLYYDWDNNYKDDNGKIHVPKRTTVYEEKDFTILCNQFKNTVFENVYNKLVENYNIGRVRIMNIKPKSCLTWHQDNFPRIHFPMKTQEGCFMVIEDEVLHLQKNTWYFTDTTKKHTAFNASKEERLHLVASLG